MAKIDEIIKQLDVSVPTETTTFIIPLKAAHATDVATALSQHSEPHRQIITGSATTRTVTLEVTAQLRVAAMERNAPRPTAALQGDPPHLEASGQPRCLRPALRVVAR